MDTAGPPGRSRLADRHHPGPTGGPQAADRHRRFSTLVGKADLVEVSSQLDPANTATTHSVSLTERDVLRPEEIRLIPDGQALVIYRNSPAMIVDLIPWTKRPDHAEIAAGIERVRVARIGRRT